MRLARTLLSFVIAFAIAFGPFGAATSAGHGDLGRTMGHHASAMHDMAEMDHSVAQAVRDQSAMADCDHAQPDAAADCRCCDTKAKCPAAACPMTCCKVIGVTRATVLVRMFEPVSYRPNDPLRPPDWSAEPTGAVLYRGAGIDVVWPQLSVVTAIGGVFLILALARFRATMSPDH